MNVEGMITHKTAVILANADSTVVQRLSEYANNNWYKVERVFEHRDTVDACRRYCVEHHIDAILVESLNVLGSTLSEVRQLLRDCDLSHINIYCLREDIAVRNHMTGERTQLIKVLEACAMFSAPDKEQPRPRRGRQVGYRKADEVKREEYADVLQHIQDTELSDRAISRITGCSASTVRRLRAEYSVT